MIAYQIRQSFKPGEVTPEEANRIGYEFVMRFTKGDHAFIVATHTDKAHIHNHIYWNSTSLECDRKFRNFWGSTEAVRRLSDLVCMEHRLSVIDNPKPHGQSYNKWLGGQAKPCNRDLLRAAIDAALAKKPQSFDELIELVKQSGYEVRFGKNIVFSRPGQKQNIRLKSLGEDYSETALRAVIAGSKTHAPYKKRRVKFESKHPRLLEQIESRLGSGKGAAYDRAIKVSALKTRAATLLFLQQHDFEDLASFEQYCSGFSEKMSGIQSRIKADETRMSENAVLQKQIINYVKTKDVYTGVANPWTEHAALADAESAVGFELSAPDRIEGYDAPIYRTLSGVMLEILYPGENGEVRIRKQAATDTVGNDISGDYNEYTEYTAISAAGENAAITLSGNDGAFSRAIWTADGYAYSITIDPAVDVLTMSDLTAQVI